MKNKIYIIRKYVVAKDIKDAIKKEKHQDPDDVWLEETTSRKLCEDILSKKNDK